MTLVRRGCNRNASRRMDSPSLASYKISLFLYSFFFRFSCTSSYQFILSNILIMPSFWKLINHMFYKSKFKFFSLLHGIFFSNCNKITTCTSTDKWIKQLLVDLSFFSSFRSLYYLWIEKGTSRRGMYRDGWRDGGMPNSAKYFIS